MDDIDRRILALLLADGRATFHAIGTTVGLSAPAVKRRVDRMRTRDDITGFTAMVDHAALGWDTEAYVELSYRGNVSPAQLTRDLSAIPEVVGAWTITGDADALVHILASGIREVERTVERMRGIKQVERTRTVIAMSRLLERPRARAGEAPSPGALDG
jgi:DNA-binding Lrp family transcriptional regulator